MEFADLVLIEAVKELNAKIAALETEKSEYENKLEEAIKHKNTILNNKEKFAREQYMFHKDNEEVILIPTKKNSKKK